MAKDNKKKTTKKTVSKKEVVIDEITNKKVDERVTEELSAVDILTSRSKEEVVNETKDEVKVIKEVDLEETKLITTVPTTQEDDLAETKVINKKVVKEVEETIVVEKIKDTKEEAAPKKAPKPTKQRRWTRANTIILLAIVVFALPFGVLGFNLMYASSQTGTPIIGDRFKDDFDPAITSDNMKEINTSLAGIDGVNNVDVILKVATLRVYLEVDQAVAVDGYKAILDEAYQKIVTMLPKEQYFSVINDVRKQYDLEIHATPTGVEYTADNFIYYILNKSSNMPEPKTQNYAVAVNPELAAEISKPKDDGTNTNPDGDITGPVDNEDGDGE